MEMGICSHCSITRLELPWLSPIPITPHASRNKLSHFDKPFSGANRGIGYGLAAALAERPNAIVYAGARDPSKATQLNELAKKYPGKVKVVKLTSGDVADNQAAAELIKKESGKLDVVLANAGISDYGPIATTPISEFNSHYQINAIGPVVLYQSIHTLFPVAPTSKFITISTAVASLADDIPLPASAYGSSKAALNFITKRIHLETENTGLVAFPVNPGWVATEMGNRGAAAAGMARAPLELDDSVSGILKLADESTRETHGGKFMSFDGTTINW